MQISQGVSKSEIESDAILVTIGIKPNRGGLNLEVVGVKTDLKDMIFTHPTMSETLNDLFGSVK